MEALAETDNFADWFDALRSQGESVATAVLPSAVAAKLETVARHYEKQSSVSERKRHRVGVLLIGSDEDERNAAVEFLSRRLCLRSVRIDGAAMAGADENAATAALRPLVDHVALIAVVSGVSRDADARLRDAIAWSSRDVMLVGFADSLEAVDGSVRRPFESVVELAPKKRSFGIPFMPRDATVPLPH